MNDEKLIEKKVKSELIYDGRVLHLYRDDVILPNGNKDIREYCAHNGGVCVDNMASGHHISNILSPHGRGVPGLRAVHQVLFLPAPGDPQLHDAYRQ